MAFSRNATFDKMYIQPGTFNPKHIVVNTDAIAALKTAREQRTHKLPGPVPCAEAPLVIAVQNAISVRKHAKVAAPCLMMPERNGQTPLARMIFVSEACCSDLDTSDVLRSFPGFRVEGFVNHNIAHPRHKAGSMLLVHDSIQGATTTTCVADGIEIIVMDLFNTVPPHTFHSHVHESQ